MRYEAVLPEPGTMSVHVADAMMKCHTSLGNSKYITPLKNQRNRVTLNWRRVVVLRELDVAQDHGVQSSLLELEAGVSIPEEVSESGLGECIHP
jgi:hypothetical protein